MDEEYIEIKGYDNYAISNFGNVLNITTGDFLKYNMGSNGYYQIRLSKNGIVTTYSLHQLLAKHFIPNPKLCPCVDHIDRDKTNNSISNLRWVTHQENMLNKTKRQNCSSIYKGVHFNKKSKKWECQIKIDNKKKYLGLFETELEAGRAFNNYVITNGLEGYVLNNI